MMVAKISLFSFLLVTSILAGHVTSDQALVNNIARYLNIRYYVLDNFANSWVTFDGKITLENTGPDIPAGNDKPWALYFCHTRLFEPERIRPNGALLGSTGLRAFHVNGCLHKMEATGDFVGITRDQTLEIAFRGSDWEIARSDVMPNWYVTASGAEPRTIDSTSGYDLDWVGDFDNKNKWKRQPDDAYNPYTAMDRFTLWDHTDTGMIKHVIPTPMTQDLDPQHTTNIYNADWVVVAGQMEVYPEAMFLADKLNKLTLNASDTPTNRYILLELDPSQPEAESYELLTDETMETITIKGKDRAGAFYGAQTLLSLAYPNGDVPHGQVTDQPRFGYRGMFADVGRNFRQKEDILKLLEVMAMYKLNKFHFHLSDDEGWRLEIPGLPELTEVGSRRCHDETGDSCIMPQLGSPPGLGDNDGTGHYTVEEYKEILRYANDRHIQVIPEFDMPGHSHAPINAMLARYRKYKDTDPVAAEEFLLNEPGDTSQYLSVQYFTDNGINPCLNSSYAFVRHLVQQIKAIHADIQPLTTFHFGGDEVPNGAWINSTSCTEAYPSNTTEELKLQFAMNVAEIVDEEGMDLAGWEDGFTDHDGNPIAIDDLLVDKAYGYFWNNVWEWGTGERAYVMANAGYKAILAHATHLYFDHPQEPDPEDRGYYWATRISPARKVFGFMPDSMYENIGVDRMGNPLDKDTICADFGCTPLQPDKVENVIGIQGHLWSETVRTSENFDYMVYTRMLTIAERAWHKASWESVDDVTERDKQTTADWESFANTMGHKELTRLDDMGIDYAVLPPGAKVEGPNNELSAVAEFPGLPIWYSMNNGNTWSEYAKGTQLSNDDVCGSSTVQLITRSANHQRQSRAATLDVSGQCVISSSNHPQMAPLVIVLCLLTTKVSRNVYLYL